jgi:hypothetical protein
MQAISESVNLQKIKNALVSDHHYVKPCWEGRLNKVPRILKPGTGRILTARSKLQARTQREERPRRHKRRNGRGSEERNVVLAKNLIPV